MKIEKINISEVKMNPDNPRTISIDKFKKLKDSIKQFPEMLDIRPIVVDENMVVLGGNMRLKACLEVGLEEVNIIKANDLSEEQKKEFIIKDNIGYGEWDWSVLNDEWSDLSLGDWGLDIVDDSYKKTTENVGSLIKKFVIPPFSILDGRAGYWQDRKKLWSELILDKGESRKGVLSRGGLLSNMNDGVSVLDPILAEIAVRWFGKDKCNSFDPFAGDTVFGYVSNYFENNFIGIELRQEQVDLNNKRVVGNNSKYVCDDGQNVLKYIEPDTQDLLFSCPPYFDLEVYSDLEKDASNQDTYEDFLKILDNAFSDSIKCLKENSFAFIVVGDIRDRKGAYRNFPNDIKDIFSKGGMVLYNEMIKIDPLGTLPLRVAGFMQSRKLGKTHQNVLVFYKGDTTKIKDHFKEIEIDTGDDVLNFTGDKN